MRTVWITGASRGIGRAIACSLAKDCETFFILSGRQESPALRSLSKDLSRQGHSCLLACADLSDPACVQRMLDTVFSAVSSVDILVNNAGEAHFDLLYDTTPAGRSRLVQIDLLSAMSLCAAVVPGMVHKKSGRILNLSSVWGQVGASCETVYSAAKGGINSFTKALAKELAPSHIPVNALAPGFCETEMNARLTEEDRQALFEEIPYGRGATPSEVAEMAHLILKAPTYLTGQIIAFDGGWC